MFFERVEIQQLLGCLIMCFPKYLEDLEEDKFAYSNPGLHDYYRNYCLVEAQKAIDNSPELELWIKETSERHEDLPSYKYIDFSNVKLQRQCMKDRLLMICT